MYLLQLFNSIKSLPEYLYIKQYCVVKCCGFTCISYSLPSISFLSTLYSLVPTIYIITFLYAFAVFSIYLAKILF